MTEDVLEPWRDTPLYRTGNILLYTHHVVMLACCLAFFIHPARTFILLHDFNAETWGLVWSLMLGVFSVVGFWSRITERWMSEGVAVVVIGLSLILWGIVLIAVNGPIGLQTGLALGAGGFYRLGWAVIQFAWIIQPPALERVISMVSEKLTNGHDEESPP